MSSWKKGISKKMNDKTFTNSLKLKILKYSLWIMNENMIRHRRTFKNSYSSSWKLIVLIDFNVFADFTEHSIHYIIFFYVSKRKMHFASTDKDENVKLYEIAITFSMICDFFYDSQNIKNFSKNYYLNEMKQDISQLNDRC